jgi:hypothetical protein
VEPFDGAADRKTRHGEQRVMYRTAVDVGQLNRPNSYELRNLRRRLPEPDTVVLVFMVASQNRLGTEPTTPGLGLAGSGPL